ncbi:MAG TPA: glutamine synthetase III [Firmicutes bacterium]|nr:glutamine synthetase III [Bacillota bacterium]
MINVPELFGSMVFGDREMKKRLSPETYKALKTTISADAALSPALADEIAEAMKNWAIEKGATHYTHWFQPMTGLPAEKHDSFIDPQEGGSVIMTFKGKELIKGEPDASSFPSGGMRETAEARGYTAWDPTSYAFVMGTTLYIPTCFISYTGEILDKKTPLLRSMSAVSKVAAKLANLLGVKCKSVKSTVGPEQEYFLIDKQLYNARKDLIYTGRTLFGAAPPKGQELEDQYFGSIRTRVMEFMEDVDMQLWKLGVNAKTRHNEVAPCQHELAPVYSSINVATDHNLLTMEVLKKTAEKHGLACLLHEKPFKGVNGSGKHNNWSISTDTGVNLLSPGKDPANNLLFLATVAAVIEAVHKHSDLLRLSVATAGNDHRLGANEAPPAIISVYLGDQIKAIFDAIEAGKPYKAAKSARTEIGVDVIPDFEKDNSDRNRTSPFAFTGNKFEFRALGSSLNIGCPNVMINVAVADAMEGMVEKLSKVKPENMEKEVRKLIKETYSAHKAVVFNGNNYSDEWIKVESKKRGLPEIKSTPEALPYYTRPDNIALFEHFGIFSARECEARKEILLEQYAKVINIEAHTMYKMTAKQILPACVEFMNVLSESVRRKRDLDMTYDYEGSVLYKASRLVDAAYAQNNVLADLRKAAAGMTDIEAQTKYLHDVVLAQMEALRATVDELELLISSDYWPLPSYGDMLFYQD